MKLITKIFLITIFTANIIYSQNDILLSDNGINPFVEVDKFNNYHFFWNEFNGKVQYACYDSNLVLKKEIKPLPYSKDRSECISLSINDTLLTASWLNFNNYDYYNPNIVIETFSLNSNRILLDSSKSFHVSRLNNSYYGTWISDSLYLVAYNNHYENSNAFGITAQVFNLFTNNKSELYQLSNHLLDNGQGSFENIKITRLKIENTFLLTWTDIYNHHPNIWGRFFNSDMQPNGDSFLINQPANYDYPDFFNIRVNNNQHNEIVFSWINRIYGADGFGTSEIKWRWMDEKHNFLTNEKTVSSQNNVYLDLDININNNIILVWDTFDNEKIRGQRYSNNNEQFGVEFPISIDDRTNNQYQPKVKFNNNKFLTIWEEYSQANKSFKLYSNIYEFTDPYLNLREIIENVNLCKNYLKSEGDSLTINVKTKLINNFVLFAEILDDNKNSIDKIQLFDDGSSGDIKANDSIFSNYFINPKNIEKNYLIDIHTLLNESDTNSLVSKEAAHFTSIGPVIVKDLIYASIDTIPNPGELVRFKLALENKSNYAIAKNVTAQIISDDTAIQGIQRSIVTYSNITANNFVIPESEFVFRFNSNFDKDKIIPFEVKIFSNNNFYWSDSFYIQISALTDKGEDINNLPSEFKLFQNYPNPFNPVTTINYSIPSNSVMLNSIQHLNNEIPKQVRDNNNVKIIVFDILGKRVATLVNKNQKPGNYLVQFDGSNLTSGIYYYQIKAGNFVNTKKMVLLK